MKIYVASKFQNYAAVRMLNDRLAREGHEITFDWTRSDQFDTGGHPLSYNDESSPEAQARSAAADFAGVLEAEAMILLGYPGLCGALVEFGAACGRRIPVFVLDPTRCFTIFYTLPNVCVVDSLGQAIAALNALSAPETVPDAIRQGYRDVREA